MAGNIELRFNAQTNMRDVAAQFNALGKTIEQMQRRVARAQDALNKRGEFVPLDYQRMQTNMRAVMNQQNDLLNASGKYTTATRTLTAETTRFNEQLARQKVRIRDIWGKDNMRMVRSAMNEQMALNNMMVRQFSRDATGKIKADIIVPSNIHTKSWENLRQQAGYYNQVLRSVSQETVNWGKNTQWAGRQLTVGFSVPISIAAGFMSRFALEADASLTRIAKVYGDTEGAFQATNDSIKAMAQDTARYVAEQYGIAAEETRSVMAELAATGLEGPELQRMTTQVQRTSLLGEMNSEQSLKLLRTMKEVYGFSSQQLAEQVNYFNAIENSTALTMQDITEGLPRIAGIMKATGTTIQEQTELMVAFKSAGIDIAEGANALKSINFKAVAATPTAAKNFFRITGVDMQDLIDKTEGRFLPMMMEISKVMQDLENQEQVELIARIFNIHQGSRAITLLQQLTAGSEGMLRAQQVGLKDAAELAQVANGEIEDIQESLSVRFKRLVESIKISMSELGKPILDVILPLGEKLAEFVQWFTELPEGVQKAMAKFAVFLAASGPFVMLAGLIGNLVGTGGKLIGFMAGLVVKFKILNPLQKAAAELQRKMQSETVKGTSAIEAQTIAVNQLTEALRQQANAMNMAGPPEYTDEFIKTVQKRGETFHPYGMAAGPNLFGALGVDTYDQARRKAIKRGEDKKAWPTTLAGYEAQLPEAQRVAIDNARRSREEERQRMATEAHLTKIRGEWTAVGQKISIASGAALTLASITGNEVLANVSMVGMSIAGFLPMLQQMSEKFTNVSGAMAVRGKGLGAGLGKSLAGAAATGIAGFGKFLSFMTGPFGLAITAVVGIVAYHWQKHKKEVEETVKTYERLSNTAEAMGSLYDFTPTTRLEREAGEGGVAMDENTLARQRERIRELREEQTEFYEDLKKFAKDATDESGEAAKRTTILAKAVAEGQKVLAATGDSELARRAAWDLYSAMTNEFMTFEAFSVKVKLDGQSMEQLLSDVDAAGRHAARRLGESLSRGPELGRGMFRNFTVSDEEKSRIQAEMSDLLGIIDNMVSDEGREKALVDALGGIAGPIGDLYRESIANGLIPRDTDVKTFLDQFHAIAANAVQRNASDIGGFTSGFVGMSAERVAQLQAEGQALGQVDEALLTIIGRSPQWAGVYAGNTEEVNKYTDALRIQALEEEKIQVLRGTDKEAARARADEIDRQIDALYREGWELEQQVDRRQKLNSAVMRGTDALGEQGRVSIHSGNMIMKNAFDSADAQDDLGESARNATEALKEQVKVNQQNALSALQTAASYGQNRLVDMYVAQFDKIQAAEKKAEEAKYQTRLDNIEKTHDDLEEAAEARERVERKAFDKRQERERDALDLQRDNAMEALDIRRDALKEQEKAEEKALKKAQAARRDQISAVYDAQIQAIRDQISEEERLEDLRQKMYERERERISRMRELFSNNIDLNMAINSGDLDEAARIANDMSSKQADWATQDLSEISADGSKSRKDAMNAQIDAIEERKKAELDALSEVEEKEKEALDAKFKRMEDELEAEKKKQQKIYDNLKKALADRHTLEKEALDDRLQAERETRDKNRTEEIAEEQASIERDRAVFDEGQKSAKDSFDKIAEHWRQLETTKKSEFEKSNVEMSRQFGEFSDGIVTVSAEDVESINNDMQTKYKNTVKELENEQMWKKFADNISDSLLAGAFGFMDWSVNDRKDFILNGVLPKSSGQARTGGSMTGAVIPYQHRHSGGVIDDGNKYNKTTGPGFRGKHQEIGITALKGEGVVNLRGMAALGEQGLAAINSGNLNALNPKDPRQGMGGGGSIANGLGSIIPMIARRMTEQMLLSGLEVGTARALETGDVNIELGEKQRQGLTDEQLSNASAIISTGRRMGATQRDIITALMTAMQESSLRNLGYGDDIHGVRNPDGTLTSSLGLFQQQKWWGTREERLDPNKSAEIFFRELMKVPGREDMPLWAAAQEVQRSAYPRAYAQWESLARTLYGGAQFSNAGVVNFGATSKKRIEDLQKKMQEVKDRQRGYYMPASGLITSLFGPRTLSIGSSFHNGMDIANSQGTPIYAAMSGIASNRWSPGGGNVLGVNTGDGVEHLYLHLLRSLVKDGEEVKRGQKIAIMGNTGSMTTGPHLHFEVRKNGNPTPAENFFSPKPTLRSNVIAGSTGIPGMSMGGLVPGQGRGDRVLRRLEPGEFVMSRMATAGKVDLFKAINNGEVDFTRVDGSLKPSTISAKSVDNAGGNQYYVNIDFSGPVNSDLDIENGVRKALKKAERNKPQNRRINK